MTPWAPIDRGVRVAAAATAADARPLHVQLQEYEVYATQIGHAAHARSVTEALQLLEARHGFNAIAQQVYFLGALIGSAERAFVGGFERLARVEGQASTGAFAGLLVERYAGVSGNKRLFPPGRASHQETSPHVTLEDLETGTHLALSLAEVEQLGLGAGAPFAQLANTVRVRFGKPGWDILASALASAKARFPDWPQHARADFFITLAGSELTHVLRLCAPWNLYWTRRLTR